jgi:hypothetical protein
MLTIKAKDTIGVLAPASADKQIKDNKGNTFYQVKRISKVAGVDTAECDVFMNGKLYKRDEQIAINALSDDAKYYQIKRMFLFQAAELDKVGKIIKMRPELFMDAVEAKAAIKHDDFMLSEDPIVVTKDSLVDGTK